MKNTPEEYERKREIIYEDKREMIKVLIRAGIKYSLFFACDISALAQRFDLTDYYQTECAKQEFDEKYTLREYR